MDTLVNRYVEYDSIKQFTNALQKIKLLKSLQVWIGNQENEHKAWKDDVNIIATLAKSEHAANAIFTPLDEIYDDNNPSFAMIVLF